MKSNIKIPLNMPVHPGECTGVDGFVYLLHFEKPYKGCRHYLGFANDIDQRMQRHQDGRGNGLVKAVLDAGINVHLVRVWSGCRNFERKLKRQKNAHRYCPECGGQSCKR